MKGNLVLLIGVPGAGKSTLMQYARETYSNVVFPMSWTTRLTRPGEIEGVTYHFATDEEFTRAIDEGRFLEWVTIDGGRRYGTLKEDIMSALAKGTLVIREVEPIGARRIKELLPNSVVTIFLTAGSWDDMLKRITKRAPIGEEELEKRRERYERELPFEREADFVISNRYGELECAKQELSRILEEVLHVE